MELGKKIKELRRSKKLSQSVFAELIGKKIRIVQKYESNEVVPSIDVLLRIAEILEVPLADLFKSTQDLPELSDDDKEILKSRDLESQNRKKETEMIDNLRDIYFNKGVNFIDANVLKDIYRSNLFELFLRYICGYELKKMELQTIGKETDPLRKIQIQDEMKNMTISILGNIIDHTKK